MQKKFLIFSLFMYLLGNNNFSYAMESGEIGSGEGNSSGQESTSELPAEVIEALKNLIPYSKTLSDITDQQGEDSFDSLSEAMSNLETLGGARTWLENRETSYLGSPLYWNEQQGAYEVGDNNNRRLASERLPNIGQTLYWDKEERRYWYWGQVKNSYNARYLNLLHWIVVNHNVSFGYTIQEGILLANLPLSQDLFAHLIKIISALNIHPFIYKKDQEVLENSKEATIQAAEKKRLKQQYQNFITAFIKLYKMHKKDAQSNDVDEDLVTISAAYKATLGSLLKKETVLEIDNKEDEDKVGNLSVLTSIELHDFLDEGGQNKSSYTALKLDTYPNSLPLDTLLRELHNKYPNIVRVYIMNPPIMLNVQAKQDITLDLTWHPGLTDAVFEEILKQINLRTSYITKIDISNQWLTNLDINRLRSRYLSLTKINASGNLISQFPTQIPAGITINVSQNPLPESEKERLRKICQPPLHPWYHPWRVIPSLIKKSYTKGKNLNRRLNPAVCAALLCGTLAPTNFVTLKQTVIGAAAANATLGAPWWVYKFYQQQAKYGIVGKIFNAAKVLDILEFSILSYIRGVVLPAGLWSAGAIISCSTKMVADKFFPNQPLVGKLAGPALVGSYCAYKAYSAYTKHADKISKSSEWKAQNARPQITF